MLHVSYLGLESNSVMARRARIVLSGYPHHVIQRGNHQQAIFFSDYDNRLYIKLLSKFAKKAGIKLWAYCLMSNHVHLIAVPDYEKSLAEGIGALHRTYTQFINKREGWKGHLFQERFLSYPMDEKYLYAAVRYVELNPVRAGIVKNAEEYPWSSARAHIFGNIDILLNDDFMRKEIGDWAEYLQDKSADSERELFKRQRRMGRPLGDEKFIGELERITGRILRKRKPGPKKNPGTGT